jgi:2'-5' RNA ligase
MPRLFLALWPPDHVVEALSALHRKEQRGARFVPPENWHVTLRFLGESNPSEVLEAMSSVPLSAGRASLGPAVDVLSGRSLVVPVSGLDELAAVVVTATRDIGDAPPTRRFFGHVTIARLKRDAAMPRALGTPVSSAWEADEVALVQSRLHPDGVRYETIHAWPVSSGDADSDVSP